MSKEFEKSRCFYDINKASPTRIASPYELQQQYQLHTTNSLAAATGENSQRQNQLHHHNHLSSRKSQRCGLGISSQTGRLQWCPDLTCCKLLIIIPVIMLPVALVLILLIRMDGMLAALGVGRDQVYSLEEQPMDYLDKFDENAFNEAINEQFIMPPGDDGRPFSQLNEAERLKRCIAFKFGLTETTDIEEHDIMKDARTSFLPSENTVIPRECLEILGFTRRSGEPDLDYNSSLDYLRKRTRRMSGQVNGGISPNVDVGTDFYDDGSETNDRSISSEQDEIKALKEQTAALLSFWNDRGSKESIRRSQARTMQSYMDTNIDPCQDFYQYSCGNWEKLHPIPKDKAGFDTFEMLRESLDLVLKQLLESKEFDSSIRHVQGRLEHIQHNNFEPKTDTQADIVQPVKELGTPKAEAAAETALSEEQEAAQLRKHIIERRDLLGRVLTHYKRNRRQVTNSKRKRLISSFGSNLSSHARDSYEENARRKARDLYKSCINTKLLQKRGIDPLLALVQKLGGWPALERNWNPNNFDWLNLTAHLRRYNNDIFIVEWVGPDIKNSDENVIQFDQTSLGLPTREYFLQDVNAKYLQAYERFMSEVMQKLGASRNVADRTAADLIAFETKLAGITSPAEQRLNVTKLYKRMTIRQLHDIVPQIDWLRYLSILQERSIDDKEQVVIYALDYMHNLVSLIESTEKETVANYLLWRFVRHRINNVDDRFEDIKQSFYHTLFGREESPSRWKVCIAQVNTNMGMALGAMFVEKYFDENSKQDTMKMTHELQQAFRDILKTTDWLDPATKHLAELKVNAMSLKIGYPDFILNIGELNEKYSGIEIEPDKYFENTLNVLLHTSRTEQRKVRESVNKTTWQTAPAIVNAYYSRNKNQIMFPAGILQPPFYHRHFPRALNFGGIGVVIGHELTHGFDDKGRLFDRNGSIHKWWTDASIKAFDEKARCIIAQYSNYTVNEIGVTLNGESTQGENIADNGGIRQAFHAYKRWLHENPTARFDEHLPGLNMTGEQLFFLNFGQVWCGAMRPEAVRNKLNTAIHSPGRFRVIGTVSNSKDFAREFNCPDGAPMNPVHKCSVW